MRPVPLRIRSLGRVGRVALVASVGLVAWAVASAPAWAASWSAPVALPGSCGSSVALNPAGATAAGGTFTAADGSTHVEVCTSSDGKSWQATDLGAGGNEPNSGPRPAVAVASNGQVIAVWGTGSGCPGACSYTVQAAVRSPGGVWGAPVTLTTALTIGNGGIVLGTDGSGRAIAAWIELSNVHEAVLSAGGTWGPDTAISDNLDQGPAHDLSLAVDPSGAAIVAFNGGLNNLWAVSGSMAGGFSAPVEVALGYGNSNYHLTGLSALALNNAGQASIAWSVTGHTGTATRSPAGAWSAPTILATQASASVSTAIDGGGDAITVYGSSYAWDPAGAGWGTPVPLATGSTGGLVVADQAGTFVYADSTADAFTFAPGAANFGPGSGARGSLADLTIVPGQAVVLAGDAVFTEPVN
ncbi:hypothetical protein KDL01_36155 [Actinospica durhamensis]|uniref:Uncharacterized protein n=1 Tax=Actinospica durhamensis TaxID=1508375 RepID=A0A941EYD6_9ACTN|nr:hypothetical protein [Actinospica durhamensis]MBR7838758.1 hypothetical protein [Actinospica durhamensis]